MSKRNRIINIAITLFLYFSLACSNVIHDSVKDLKKIELEPLKIVSISPANGATGVAKNAIVQITFNQALSENSVSAATISITRNGSPVIGNISYNDKIATFTPASDMPSNQLHEITVTSDLKAITGVSLTENFVSNFTTGDFIAPVIVSVSPLNNAANVSKTANILITFSKNMNESTLNSTNVSIKDGSTPITGVFSYADKVLTFDPDNDLPSQKIISISLNNSILDLSGNNLQAEYNSSFTIEDFTRPQVSSTSQPLIKPVLVKMEI